MAHTRGIEGRINRLKERFTSNFERAESFPVPEAVARKFKGAGGKTLQAMIDRGLVTPDPDRKRPLVVPEKRYLIWSFEHDAWWAPRSNGYVRDFEEAGIYGEAQALQIVRDANRFSQNRDLVRKPNEALVPV